MQVYIYLLAVATTLACCKRTPDAPDATPQQRTAVTLTQARYGHIDEQTALTATTAYLRKATVNAPIAAFVTTASIVPGNRVRAGQTIFRLESKEQHALGTGTLPPITVAAPLSGVVLDVTAQTGSYVAEGTPLCTIAETSSLVFLVDVPYEQRRLARTGNRCTLELPDGTHLIATIVAPLATMDATAQTERVVARAKSPFLPEGMTVRAIFDQTGSSTGHLILPRSAVQADETLTSHWLMTVGANHRARRVDVEVQRSNDSLVELRAGNLKTTDHVILTGGYSLEPGDEVVVKR